MLDTGTETLTEGEEAAEEGDGRETVTAVNPAENAVETPDGIDVVLGEAVDPPGLNVVQRHDHEIDIVLAAFRGRKPSLARPAADVAARVAAALLDIGHAMGDGQVRVISLGDLGRFAALMPADASAGIAEALHEAFAKSAVPAVAKPLAAALDEAFAAPLEEIIGPDACSELAGTIWDEVITGYLETRDGPADGFAEIAWASLHRALHFQIGFTLAEMPSHRNSAAALLGLFTGGIFPLGFLRDGSFLVLTA
ncbi:MAG: hypothetical protein RL272_1265 [Candidatus Parcubacteria bacterium]|jgi:hypothetical protein